MTNPWLPEPPADGQHEFRFGSYRCSRCAVYNRPDVPSTKEVLDAPCEGRYANSGKMRAWAEDKWQEDLAQRDAPLLTLLAEMDTAASKVNNAVRHHAQLAVLKPFIAQVWEDAYAAGWQNAGINSGSDGDPDVTPHTNPFKDSHA